MNKEMEEFEKRCEERLNRLKEISKERSKKWDEAIDRVEKVRLDLKEVESIFAEQMHQTMVLQIKLALLTGK